MRHVALGAVLILLVLPALAGNANDFGGALGNWARDDGNARVRLASCGTALCATNTWIRDSAGSGEHVGDRLEMTLKPAGAATWKGAAYDPQRDRSYSMTMRLRGGKLQTQGCLLGGLLCKSTAWTRIR